jgi:ASC-1-like (ASCH) protein
VSVVIPQTKSKKMMRADLERQYVEDILTGAKTVEGKLNKGKGAEMKVGDIVEFWNNDNDDMLKVFVEIVGKEYYKTFEEYLVGEGLKNCLPRVESVADGVKVYHAFKASDGRTFEDYAKEVGVVALRIRKV